MKKPVIIATLSAIIVLALIVGLLWIDREPLVAGQPVSHWVDEVGNRSVIAKEHLMSVGDDAIDYLLQALEPESELVHDARRHYRSAWSKAPDWVRKILPPPRREHFDRREYISALGYLVPEHPRVIDALVNELGNPDSEIRFSVVTELGKAKERLSTVVIPSLISVVTNDSAFNVRGRAAYSLADMGDPARAAVPALLVSLTNSDAGVRWIAAKALGNLAQGNSEAISALEKTDGGHR